ncbi:MAG TPA: glutathione peroxidase [Bacteroidota bacterium]|nr:glutathione peroxidase [Bacteroidota bacterium]
MGVQAQKQPAKPAGVHSFTMKNIDGKEVPLSEYKGKVLLLVNVASKCGFTSQYSGLEELYRKYKDKGFVVLGFPANNFLGQEPGTDEQIKEFCSTKYDVTFDMFSKISVKGDDQHPLYRYLTAEETNSAFAGTVKWNFTKFLVNRDGVVVGRFDSRVKPMSDEIVEAVEAALK